jgi:hypothetical protein
VGTRFRISRYYTLLQTAQCRECFTDFGTCGDSVQNITLLYAASNHATLVTSSWRLAEDRNLHCRRMRTHWHPSFESSQRYSWQFQSSAIWRRVHFSDYPKNGESKFIKRTGIFITLYIASYISTMESSRTSLWEPRNLRKLSHSTTTHLPSFLPPNSSVLPHADSKFKVMLKKIKVIKRQRNSGYSEGRRANHAPNIYPFCASGLRATYSIVSICWTHVTLLYGFLNAACISIKGHCGLLIPRQLERNISGLGW